MSDALAKASELTADARRFLKRAQAAGTSKTERNVQLLCALRCLANAATAINETAPELPKPVELAL